MLYDSNGQILTSASVSIDANSQTVFQIKCECRNGFSLSASTVADLLIEARLLGDATWIDIETNPIDLSLYAGNIKDFEVRFTAGNVSVITNRDFTVSVSAL